MNMNANNFNFHRKGNDKYLMDETMRKTNQELTCLINYSDDASLRIE